jgi:hypothetical protein
MTADGQIEDFYDGTGLRLNPSWRFRMQLECMATTCLSQLQA